MNISSSNVLLFYMNIINHMYSTLLFKNTNFWRVTYQEVSRVSLTLLLGITLSGTSDISIVDYVSGPVIQVFNNYI